MVRPPRTLVMKTWDFGRANIRTAVILTSVKHGFKERKWS